MPDKLISSYQVELSEPACAPGAARWGVLVTLPGDISQIFPYLNAVLKDPWYDHAGQVLIWDGEDKRKYAFRPCEIRISGVNDISEAQSVVKGLVDRLNQVWEKRESITPRFTERKLPAVMDIYKLLPRTNCGQCGYSACMAFAAELRKGNVKLEQCPPGMKPEHATNRQKLEKLLAAD